ncbi:esterase-like activity of phytase family protein [Rhodobacteraceae bacterium M385]|nr:esterase-like activity of phytase family protein [Rhodobacteraceae bacterium M385]
MRCNSQRVLIAAFAAFLHLSPVSAQAEFRGEVHLEATAEASRFGGLSAIEMAEEGATALVLSDRGTLFDLSLTRDAGAITDVTACCGARITWDEGVHLSTAQRDSEGLAILPSGEVVISFEGQGYARLAVHGRDGAQTRAFPEVPGVAALPRNGAFEGVAADAQGRLYTLPEAMPGQGPIPLLRLDRGRWSLFAELPRSSGWSPVALDFDDRGRLYLLERRVVVPFGLSSRLTRFDVAARGLSGGEVLLHSPTGRHGNLEGLSVWRDGQGQLVATMVSDDNFLAVLNTTLVEYTLPD